MDKLIFQDEGELKRQGFDGFYTIENLKSETLREIPMKMGVYIVIWEFKNQPDFLEIGTGGFFKKKNPNVTQEMLKQSWVSDTVVVYIGKAGRSDSGATLRSRIKQYFQFGDGKSVGHYGGRYIWQIKESQKLKICWKVTEYEPRAEESRLINDFKRIFDMLPFANLTT